MKTKEQKEIDKYLQRRCDKAKDILAAGDYDANCLKTSLQDALTDLMHLAHKNGWNWWDVHDDAQSHFNAEVVGGEHD